MQIKLTNKKPVTFSFERNISIGVLCGDSHIFSTYFNISAGTRITSVAPSYYLNLIVFEF